MNLLKSIRKNYIAHTSIIISGIILLTKLLGYLEKMVIAYYWGTGYQADTYYAVITIAIGISLLFREVTEPGFLNLLTLAKKEEGVKESQKIYATLFWFVVGVAFAICVFQSVFPGVFTRIFLSGFTDERAALTDRLFRGVSVGLFFMILCAITNTYLAWEKKFFTIALSDFIYKLVIILFLVLLAGMGDIYIAILAVTLAAITKFGIHWFRIRRTSSPSYKGRDKQYLRTLFLMCWPLLIGNIFSQIGNIAHNTFASYMEVGTLSALSYAKKVIDLPVVIFPYTLSVIVFPFFSQLSVEKNTVRMRSLLNNSLKYILLFFIPLTFFMAFFPDEIVRVFFERGAFDAGSTSLTSRALAVYNAGLIAFALETILVIYLFANRRIKLPVLIGMVCVVVDILLTFVLIRYFDYLGIAWGYVLARWLKVITLIIILRKDLNFPGLLKAKTLLTVTGALGLFGVLLIAIRHYIMPLAQGTVKTLALLAGSALILYAVYFGVLYLTRIIDLRNDRKE